MSWVPSAYFIAGAVTIALVAARDPRTRMTRQIFYVAIFCFVAWPLVLIELWIDHGLRKNAGKREPEEEQKP